MTHTDCFAHLLSVADENISRRDKSLDSFSSDNAGHYILEMYAYSGKASDGRVKIGQVDCGTAERYLRSQIPSPPPADEYLEMEYPA
jgi:hypothetical protein